MDKDLVVVQQQEVAAVLQTWHSGRIATIWQQEVATIRWTRYSKQNGDFTTN